VLVAADADAWAQGRAEVGAEHLLLGLFAEPGPDGQGTDRHGHHSHPGRGGYRRAARARHIRACRTQATSAGDHLPYSRRSGHSPWAQPVRCGESAGV